MVAWRPTQCLAPVSGVFREGNWIWALWFLPRCSQPRSSCWVRSIMWCVVLTRLWLDSIIIIAVFVVQLLSRIRIFGQHARVSCPLLSPGACSNTCLLSRWCHATISSSIIPFSSHLQSFPASGSFPVSQLFVSGGRSIGASASHQSFQWILRVEFL